MGPENKVEPWNKVGPGNRVGPVNNFEIPKPSASCGSIRLVKLVSKSPLSHHLRLSGYEVEETQLKILETGEVKVGHYIMYSMYSTYNMYKMYACTYVRIYLVPRTWNLAPRT